MPIYSLSPYPLLAERLRDRQVGHSAVMAALPTDLGSQPRATSQCLWRWEHSTGVLTVQASTPINASVLGRLIDETPLPDIEAGSRWHIDVVLECQKTPPSDVPVELRPVLKQTGRCYRSRKVVVPEAERPMWLQGKFSRHGFTLDPASIELGPVAIADLGRRGGGIPYVHAVATGTPTDVGRWTSAITCGIGGGRNFGLGLIHTQLLERLAA